MNQDSVFAKKNKGAIFIAVSDGVGSEKNSKLGSEFATKVLSSRMAECKWNSDYCKNMLKSTKDVYKKYALKNGITNYKTLACTLAAAYIDHNDNLVTVNVGDSYTVVIMTNGVVHVLTENKEKYDMGVEETTTLIHSDNRAEVNCFSVDKVDSVFVFTDGLKSLTINHNIENVLKHIDSKDDVILLFDHLKNNVKTITDDISLAMMKFHH